MKLKNIVINESKKLFKGEIICGFPGVGKSTLFNSLKDSGKKILDSDSSKFDKKDFPENYIKHIKESIKNEFIILASSHDTVRAALIKGKIPFILVYPDKKCKKEYLKRYEERGSPKTFIKLLSDNFEKWVQDCDETSSPLVQKVKLKCNEYLDEDKL